MIYCYFCKKEKEHINFSSKQKLRCNGEKGQCKECANTLNRQWRIDNPEKVKNKNNERRNNPERKEYDRQRSYLRRYGITRDEYNNLREGQNYKCFICGIHENDNISRWGVLCLDHCHRTGRIRKLLCATCNKGLGCFKDSHSLLIKAANYLNSFEKLQVGK